MRVYFYLRIYVALTSPSPRDRGVTGLFLRRGDIEVALGFGDFLGGLKELKALPLKERRPHLKNEVFMVGNTMTLSGVIYLCAV